MLRSNLNTAKRLIFVSIILGTILVVLAIANMNWGRIPDKTQFWCGTSDINQPEVAVDTVHYEMTDSMKKAGALVEEGKQIFEDNCKSCHYIHSISVGPALAKVTSRRDREWIYKFIRNSKKMIESGDTIAVRIFEEYGKAEMTAFPSFTNEEIELILKYIESEQSNIKAVIREERVIACP